MEAIRNYINDLFGQELRGLCSTCDHSIACTYRQQSTKLIIQCELFSSPEVLIPPVVNQAAPLLKRIARGLCDTCVHQRTCSFFKKNGYVWHCEEFV
jgi:hypothetical protein